MVYKQRDPLPAPSKMAWNIMLFNKTFHVEHIYFSIHVPRKFTTPYPTPNRYVERGEGYYMTKGRGWGYQKLQL